MSPQPLGPLRAHAHSSATRLLSAGAYLESYFRHLVIRELVMCQYRVVAPSYGYDAVTVLAHALAARRLRRKQIAGVVLGALGVLVLANLGAIGLLGTILLLGWLPWAFAFLRRAATLQVLITQLRGDRNQAGAAAVGAPGGEDDYPPNRRLTPELVEKIAREQAGGGEEVVYGGYHPFVGAGTQLRDWSISALLIGRQPDPVQRYLVGDGPDAGEPVEPEPVIPFTVSEITDYVGKRLLADLHDDAPYGEQVEHLTVERRKYSRAGQVPIKRRRGRRSLLLPPASHDEAFRLVENRERYDAAREYLCVRVGSWDQEVVTSMFVGFDLRGNTLYCEFYPHVLLPVVSSFHLVDRLPQRLTAKLLLRVAWDVPAGLPSAAVRLAAGWLRRARHWLWRLLRAEVSTVAVVDASEFRLGRYALDVVETGAVTSLRELAATNGYYHFFQEADTLKYIKLVERRLLATIRTFLAEHNVDLGDYDARQTTILDNSTNNYGNATIYGDGNISQGARRSSQSIRDTH